MITSLKIQNFQSHKDSSLNFHPGVNVIVGASDSGKTAILRALRWLIWNRPGGEDFRSDWGGETSVEIVVDNKSIIRSKDKENLYSIGDVHSQDFKELKAFGTKVPEEIQALLNIDDTNLQKQFDSPFLISSSPGEVAGYFNQVAHLEVIDSSISYVNGKILSLNSSHKTDQAALKEQQAELERYAYLEKFEIDLEELEHQQSEYIREINSRKKLKEHTHTISTIEDTIKKQERILVMEKPVDELLFLHGELNQMKAEWRDIHTTLNTIRRKKREEEELTKKAELAPRVKALMKLHEERESLKVNHRSLHSAIQEIKDTKQRQITWETLIESKEKLLHKYMPDICPLCGNKTTGS